MSDFSAAYFLKGSVDDAEKMLRRAGTPGFVLETHDGWTCFVIGDADDFEAEPDPALVSENDRVLVHYTVAEDHGWGLTVLEGSAQILSSFQMHEEVAAMMEMIGDDAPGPPASTDEASTAAAANRLGLTAERLTELLDQPLGYELAEVVGFQPAEFISIGYVSRHTDEYPIARRVQ